MAVKVGGRPPKKEIEDLYDEASASVAAETFLQAVKPQWDRAFNLRLKLLFDAAPELGAVLDARAQLKAIYDLREGLEKDVKKGKAAVEVFNQLLVKSA